MLGLTDAVPIIAIAFAAFLMFANPFVGQYEASEPATAASEVVTGQQEAINEHQPDPAWPADFVIHLRMVLHEVCLGPPIMQALQEREQRIADGLEAAADRSGKACAGRPAHGRIGG